VVLEDLEYLVDLAVTLEESSFLNHFRKDAPH
jgi:hypothetical protein